MCMPKCACCVQARCELAAGAQCSGGNECCDAATCRPLPTSATCAAGAGICLSGRCLTAATAVELGVQRDTWPGLTFAPMACPLRDGCTLLLETTDGSISIGLGGAATLVSGGCGARAVPLPKGTPCTVAGGGAAGGGAAGGGAAGGGEGRCVLVGARDGVCVPVARCGNGVVEPGEARC